MEHRALNSYSLTQCPTLCSGALTTIFVLHISDTLVDGSLDFKAYFLLTSVYFCTPPPGRWCCSGVRSGALQCGAVWLCCAALCSVVGYSAVRCCAVRCSGVGYGTVLPSHTARRAHNPMQWSTDNNLRSLVDSAPDFKACFLLTSLYTSVHHRRTGGGAVRCSAPLTVEHRQLPSFQRRFCGQCS